MAWQHMLVSICLHLAYTLRLLFPDSACLLDCAEQQPLIPLSTAATARHACITWHFVTMQKVDQKREDVGVELYGYQQQLAKLQLGFEKAQDQCLVISKVRRTLEEQLDQLKKAATSELDFTQKERQKARWQAHPLTSPTMTQSQALFPFCKQAVMA